MEIFTQLAEHLPQISLLASRLMAEQADCDLSPGRLRLSKRLAVGADAYAVTLFDGVEDATIDRYQTTHRLKIPDSYRSVLRVLNGANVFRLDLYGLPRSMIQDPPFVDRSQPQPLERSMIQDPPFVDRSQPQPLDLAAANRHWRRAFTSEATLFHIGSGPLNASENLAYFLAEDNGVRALRKGGRVVSSWPSISEFLEHELPRAQAAYPEFEAFMARLRKHR